MPPFIQAEIARLKAEFGARLTATAQPEIARLKAEIARLKAQATQDSAAKDQEIAQLRARVAEMEAAFDAKPVTVEPSKTVAELKAENARLESKLRATIESGSHLAQMVRKGLPPVTFTPGEHKLLRGCLHPDRALDSEERKRYDKAFKLFTDRLAEELFVEKPKPRRPQPPPLPETAEEWTAAKLRAEKESRAKRAARAAERKAAKSARRIEE